MDRNSCARRQAVSQSAAGTFGSLGCEPSGNGGGIVEGALPGHKPKPIDIPANPYETYKDKGWKSLGDWLGTGTVAPFLRQYRSFVESREFVRQLRLRSSAEWKRYCKGEMPDKGKKPGDIPAFPCRRYKDEGWISWGDWFGTGSVAPSLREFQPVQEGSVRSSGDSAYETRRSGKATATARCLPRGRNPMIFRLPRMFRTRVKVGPVGATGSVRER